jgi:hypothetical protein
MPSKRSSEDDEVEPCGDSQEALGEAFSNVRLNASTKMIGSLIFIFVNKYGRRFERTWC